MTKWKVYYEIGKMCDSQIFNTEGEALGFFDHMEEVAYEYQQDTEETTIVEMEEVDG